MPRKLRLTARKKHSSFSSTSANTPSTDDSVANGMCTVGTQTDSMVESMELQVGSGEGYRKVQTASKEVQTEPVKISPVEDNAELVENLLTPSSRSLIVSLPLKYFFEKKVHSTVELSNALSSLKCLHDWFCLSYEPESSTLKLVRITSKGAMTLEISYNMQWSLSVSRARINCSSAQFAILPSTITSISDLQIVLAFVNKRKVCLGISDPQFAPVTAKCKGVFMDRSDK